MGRSAFSCSSENARMVPALSAETTTQITVKSSQSFFQSRIITDVVRNSGADAPELVELVGGAARLVLRLLARGDDDGRLEERIGADARLEAPLAILELEEQLVGRLERDAELEVVGLDALLQRERIAHPAVAAPRRARHVAGERLAARRRLAHEALGLDAPARDLARAEDVVLGDVREPGIARRARRLQVRIDRRDQLRRGLRRERLAQLLGGVAHHLGDLALLRALLRH